MKLCSVTCGNGTEEYSRSCDNPAPAHGGKQCSGPSVKVSPCSPSLCGRYFLFKFSTFTTDMPNLLEHEILVEFVNDVY